MIRNILIVMIGLVLVACNINQTKHLDVSCVFNGKLIVHNDVNRVRIGEQGTWGRTSDGSYFDYSIAVPCKITEYYTTNESSEK